MIGTEAERQFYLAAAGIRMWYAREPLPGAAPSEDFDFGELDAVPVPQPELAPDSSSLKTERSKGHIAKLHTLMEASKPPAVEPTPVPAQAPALAELSPKELPDAEARNDHASVSDKQTASDIPRVTLQSWVGTRVMLIAPISDESSLSLQQTLASNILYALGESNPEALDIVHWPLFNNAGISLNNTSHLVEVLSGQLKKHEDKIVVMLGEGGDWLGNALGRQPDVRFAASLASLAGAPTLKRELWQLLKLFHPESS